MPIVEGFWKNADWIYFCNQGKTNKSMTWCISSINMKKIRKFLEHEQDQPYEEFTDFKAISDPQLHPNQAISKEYDDGTK